MVGPSKSRKTTLLKELITNWSHVTCGQTIDKVYLFYDQWQTDLYEPILNASRRTPYRMQGMPNDLDFIEPNNGKAQVIIFDDLLYQLGKPQASALIEKLFTVVSHHASVHVFLLVQQLFTVNCLKTVLKNSRYVIIMKSHQECMVSLQKQLFPSMRGFLTNASALCFNRFHRYYLVIDNNAGTDAKYRCKTGLLPSDEFGLIFVPV